MDNSLFTISLLMYLVSGILYILSNAFKKIKEPAALSVLCAGFFLHLCALIARTIKSGHTPLANLYESMAFLSWCIVLIFLYLRIKYKSKSMGVIASLLAFISIGAASVLPSNYKEIQPLMPALQSYWLEIHVITCIISYASFALAFGYSLLFLIRNYFEKSRFAQKLPEKEASDIFAQRLIAIGFPLLTLGIITGSIWANVAWGTYWSWDPKEVWSLITWLIYAIYLHTRHISKWRGVKSNWVSVIGFLAVIFTYFGVNLLLSGLHSYA